MTPERLAYMANQIATFFRSRPEAEAVAGTEDHLLKFWDPRMRAELLAHVAAGGAGLNPIARQAAERLAGCVAPPVRR
ncbi:MAG: formate dehydrogenase subunit delta [Alphaproteobacteria bacterium]|nr:formate dehydrogenase subunit delta [Alphaproteobacteria bacterium]